MKQMKYILAALCSAMVLTAGAAMNVFALENPLYLGDVETDGTLNILDIIKLQKYLLAVQPLSENEGYFADLNQDDEVDVIDLVLLKRSVLTGNWTEAPLEPIEPPTEPPTEPWTEPPSEDPVEPPKEPPTEPEISDRFVTPSVQKVIHSLPSQGNANLVVFYVDFPDCRYSYEPSLDELTAYCFGTDADVNGANYPFNSMHSFYATSSKGVMNLTGQVFRYTTTENRSAYDDDKDKLARECYHAFNEQIDFSQFDGNGDGTIDVTLLTVPTAAGDDAWWPMAGPTGDDSYLVDGVNIGYIISGNAQVDSPTDHKNFVSSYLHEMGHCMGLPDFYLYYSEDYDAMHGNAGTEMMDADAYSDFGCFSKLMLGWYKEHQVSIFDKNNGNSQTFTLQNGQTENGNCVILPYGEFNGNYFSEYMMIEYVTPDGLNSAINRDYWYWQSVAAGIRVYHIRADFGDNGWWTFFKYENGSEFTNYDDDGIRLIRLANDAEGGNVFTAGDVIDGRISGFHWYAADESESVETGYSITVGELVDGKYTITVNWN